MLEVFYLYKDYLKFLRLPHTVGRRKCSWLNVDKHVSADSSDIPCHFRTKGVLWKCVNGIYRLHPTHYPRLISLFRVVLELESAKPVQVFITVHDPDSINRNQVCLFHLELWCIDCCQRVHFPESDWLHYSWTEVRKFSVFYYSELYFLLRKVGQHLGGFYTNYSN